MYPNRFTDRPIYRVARTVGLVLIAIPLTIFASIAFNRMVHRKAFRDVSAAVLTDTSPAATPEAARGVISALPPSTLSVESEAGRAAIYVDTTTGARVLCAVGPTCVLLPAARQTTR